jgi:hypothetical protein
MKRAPQTGSAKHGLWTPRTRVLAGLALFTASCQITSALAPEVAEVPDPAPISAEPDQKATAPDPAKPEVTSAPASPPEQTLTVDQVRAAQEQALKQRESLLTPDTAIKDPEVHRTLLERWGVEILGVRKALTGYMIDFRFRVLDADKALPLFDPRTQPYVLREGSSIKLPVPVGEKVGAFRTTNRGKNIQSNRDYYMLFANPDAYVKRGDKVSVVIGDFRVDGLTLQ